MNLKATLFLIVSFTLALCQEEPSPEDYMVELRFKVREERIPGIVSYLLNSSLVEREITTRDIIQLSKLDRYDLDEIEQVFAHFNTSFSQRFNVDALECLLDSLTMEFVDFYQGVTHKLGLSDATIQQVLSDLSIDQVRFFMTVLSRNYVYDILRNGSYAADHVDAALTTMGKSGNDVYNAARDVVLDHVYQMNATDFMGALKAGGWDRRLYSELWTALNITTRDVYDVPKFREIFEAISESLNSNLTIGVFVGEDQLAVHETAFKQFDRVVDGITVKIEVGEVEVGVKPTDRLGASILALTSKQPRDEYIEITECYNSTVNCSYSTFVEHTVSTQRVEVEVEEPLKVKKGEGLVFNLGSPLTCDGRLYGLAREEEDDWIVFDRFYTGEDHGVLWEEEEEEEEVSGGDGGHRRWMWALVVSCLMCIVFS